MIGTFQVSASAAGNPLPHRQSSCSHPAYSKKFSLNIFGAGSWRRFPPSQLSNSLSERSPVAIPWL